MYVTTMHSSCQDQIGNSSRASEEIYLSMIYKNTHENLSSIFVSGLMLNLIYVVPKIFSDMISS